MTSPDQNISRHVVGAGSDHEDASPAPGKYGEGHDNGGDVPRVDRYGENTAAVRNVLVGDFGHSGHAR